MRSSASLLGQAALSSIATRLALGGFPVLLLFAVRWSWGKHVFDVAAATLNWSTYLNILLLSGFVTVPPAVARIQSRVRQGLETEHGEAQLVDDHVALGRWLLVLAALVACGLAASVDVTFDALASEHGSSLRGWFIVFAALALGQIPLALWLGVALALGRYRQALLLTAAPRACAVAMVLLGGAVGAEPAPTVALAVAVVLAGQAALSVHARRALRELPVRSGVGSARRVLTANVHAGLVVMVGAAVTIVPVTLVGRAVPEAVGAAQVIVTLANALAAVVVAAYFPRSLTIGEYLRLPGGLRRYCLAIARPVAISATVAVILGAVAGLVCRGWTSVCQANVALTAALALAGTGLRLGALGTQHAAAYLHRPEFNLTSALAEAAVCLATLALLLPSSGLLALGWALLAGGTIRCALALGVERPMLERT